MSAYSQHETTRLERMAAAAKVLLDEGGMTLANQPDTEFFSEMLTEQRHEMHVELARRSGNILVASDFEQRQLYTSVRIDDINDAHTRISIFTGYVRSATNTRGHSGELCLDTPTAADFINRLNPVQITLREGVDMPDWLRVQEG